MKKYFCILSLCLLALLSSCTAPKEVIYFQDIDQLKQEAIAREYEVKIRPDDLLAIVVTGKDQEVVLPFNLPVTSYQIGETYTQQRLVGYLVDPSGDIDFPFLGKLHVAGLTRTEVTELIKDRLSGEDLLKDPVVTVQFLNFKVSVMGEVARPGTFDITGDRVTLLEALSMAGAVSCHPSLSSPKVSLPPASITEKSASTNPSRSSRVMLWSHSLRVLSTKPAPRPIASS